jgi:hypothetical protein
MYVNETLETLRDLIEGAEFTNLGETHEVVSEVFAAFSALDAECLKGNLPKEWQVDSDPIGTHIESLVPIAIRAASNLATAAQTTNRQSRSTLIRCVKSSLAVLTHYVSLLYADFCEEGDE